MGIAHRSTWLELKVPHGAIFDALPVLAATSSFIYVGIYWNKLQYGSYLIRSKKLCWLLFRFRGVIGATSYFNNKLHRGNFFEGDLSHVHN
jgi:hypothetical protein